MAHRCNLYFSFVLRVLIRSEWIECPYLDVIFDLHRLASGISFFQFAWVISSFVINLVKELSFAPDPHQFIIRIRRLAAVLLMMIYFKWDRKTQLSFQAMVINMLQASVEFPLKIWEVCVLFIVSYKSNKEFSKCVSTCFTDLFSRLARRPFSLSFDSLLFSVSEKRARSWRDPPCHLIPFPLKKIVNWLENTRTLTSTMINEN